MPRPTFGASLEGEKTELAPSIDQSSTTLETKRYNPRYDLHFNETQKIANKLPEWNKIRKRRQSNGQVLLNNMYGRSLDDAANMSEQSFRARFLQLLPMDEPDIVHEVSIPDGLDLAEPTGVSNFIKNGYFQIWSYPHQLPDYWQYTNSSPQVIPGFIGHNALRLYRVSNSSTTTVYQDLSLFIRAGEDWTLSCFYRAASNQKPAVGDDTYGLKLIGTASDGSGIVEKRANFDSFTGGYWQRLVLNTNFSKDVAHVRIEVNYKITTAFDSDLDVTCFQLEPGTKASPWRAREDDKYPYMNRTSRSPVFVSAGVNGSTYVDDSEDFWVESIPNRAEFSQSESAAVSPATSAGRFQMNDFNNDSFYFTYKIQGGQLRFHDNKHTADILRDFYLAFRDHEGFYKIKSGFTLETLTYFSRKLWVVGKVADTTGSTIRVLYVLDPHFPWPAPTYLQVIGGCRIPNDVSIHTTMIRVEFRNEDRQHLYLFDSNYLYVVRLRYDIHTISRDRRKVLLREKYDSVSVV